MFDQLRTLPGLLAAAGFAVVLFVAAGSLVLPLGPDQAIFSWIGSVILDGGVPYRDAWDLKGPLTHYIYAAGLALFGYREISVRLLDLVTVLICCWLLRSVVLRLNQNDALGANCAVIFYCLIYYAGGYKDVAQPEGWGAILVLGAVRLLLDPSLRTYSIMAAIGALVALATLTKPVFAMQMLLPSVLLFDSSIPRRRRLLLPITCVLAFGAVIGVAAQLLINAQALDDYFDVLRYLYTTYAGGGGGRVLVPQSRSLWPGLVDLPRTLFLFGLLIPYLLVPLGIWRIRANDSWRSAALVALWWGLATVTVIAQGRYWQDHWLPAAMATAAVLGVALTYICRQADMPGRQSGARVLASLVIVAALVPAAVRALSANDSWPLSVLGVQSESAYVGRVIKPSSARVLPFNYLEQREVADYIARHTDPNDQLAIWGWDVSIHLMSERKSATRFSVFQALVDEGPVRTRYRQMFLREIAASEPSAIVVDTRGAWFMDAGTGLELLDEFPEFREFIHSRYRLAQVIGVYQVWMLPSSQV